MNNPNLIHQNDKFPHELMAYIEVQKNTRTKYEYDEKMQTLVLDRILHSAVFYCFIYLVKYISSIWTILALERNNLVYS